MAFRARDEAAIDGMFIGIDEASLYQLIAAARLPGSGISEIAELAVTASMW
jgi:hypothetical protein